MSEDQVEELDPELERLEQLHATKAASNVVDLEFVASEDTDEVDRLERSCTLLRDTAILLEYLSNPDFCKSITKRERIAIDKQSEKLWAMVNELNEAVEELQDEEEEDE